MFDSKTFVEARSALSISTGAYMACLSALCAKATTISLQRWEDIAKRKRIVLLMYILTQRDVPSDVLQIVMQYYLI